MKERPILFSGAMVRAILEGRKTMTRRVVKERDLDAMEGRMLADFEAGAWCPYGQPGDRLWVRETFGDKIVGIGDGDPIFKTAYRADGELKRSVAFGGWTPSIFMRRFQSRILLEVVSVRVERVQDISEEDAKAEGVGIWRPDTMKVVSSDPVKDFRNLWDSINAKRGYGWASNPWVWVVEFKRVTP